MNIKKFFLISIVLFILVVPVIHNINYLFSSPILDDEGNQVKTSQTSLIFGISADPITIDPINCWDANSDPYIRQVAETLFWNNLSDLNYQLEPLLVDTYSWDVTGKNLTLNLRNNIYFHDGYIFNASAVKWNVDRWLYLTNATGLLPSGPVASPSPLYFFSNGTSIINRSEIVSEFSVKIILNHRFGPFLSFLSYISNAIISPYSHSQTAYIDLTTGDLIGTGPFMFTYYTTSVEARFDRYNNYWRGPSAIETLIFSIISNYNARISSLLAHDVNIINSIGTGYLNQFMADPNITLYDAGPDLIYRYYGFNNDNVNLTWREAISYAINYSYIIEDYRGGGASRGYPAVPEGMPGHNSSVQANLPVLNRTYARILMQNMGFGTTFDIYNDSEWLSQAISSPFRDFNLLGYLGSQLDRDLLDIFTDNVEYLGCSTTQTLSVDLFEYFTALKTYPNSYDVHYLDWPPSYPDAYNMLYYLFYSSSTENTAQVDIPLVDSLLDSSVKETDESTRLDYFKQIQYILFEQKFVHAPLFADRAYFAHLSDLNGFLYNPFRYYYFYNCSTPYLGPGPFTLNSDADDPDLDGTFLLNWTDSERVSYYTVYYDTEFISEINGSQSMLANYLTKTNYSINDYPTGIYYFIIEANNPKGMMLSNCVKVNITNPGPPRISSISDRLYLKFSLSINGSDYGTLQIDYTYLSGNSFLVNETIDVIGPIGAYHVDNETRFITDIGHEHAFFGSRPVYWIFANQELGDLVSIAVDGEGDHVFNITGQGEITLPNLGLFNAWTLDDLSEDMAHALYDIETGFLLDATFYYLGGTSYYNLTLIDTNYGVIGDPPGTFLLGSTAESPELDGDFNLVWSASDRADCYFVYQSPSFITAIDGSVTLLAGDLITLIYAIENYPTGTYYFIVVAINDNGETLSNCIQVVVGTGGLPEGIPGYEPLMILGIIAVSTLLIIKKRRKKN